MIATKIALALGLVLLGIACWMAVIGVGAASEGLITVFALVILVGGGNLLAGRTAPARRPASGDPARQSSAPTSSPSGAEGAAASGQAAQPAPTQRDAASGEP